MKLRKIAQSNIQQKTLLVFGIALVIVAAVCSLFYYRTVRFIESSREVESVHRILYETEEIVSALNSAESGQKDYIITGDKNFLAPYHEALGRLDKHLGEVRRLTADNRAQQQWLDELGPLVRERRKFLADGISLRENSDFKTAQSFIAEGNGRAKIDAVQQIIRRIKTEEQKLLAQRVAESADAESDTLQTLATITLLMIFFLGVGYYQIRTDISATERAEELLKDERDFVAAIMDNSRSLTLVLDRNARIIRFNQTCEQVSGYLFEDVRGKIFWEVLPPPEQQTMIAEAFGKLTPADYPTTHENYWLSRKGERRLISWSNNALTDADGNIKFTIGTGVDITEQRQAAQALVERERLAVMDAEISQALIENRSQEDILNACTVSIVKHLDAAFARIWTLDETGETLELQASAGIYTHLDGKHSRVRVGECKIGLIAQERQPHFTNSVADDPRIGEQEWARLEKMVAFAGYPLLMGEKLVGVVALFARHPLNEAVLDALAAAATTISLGIERNRTEQALQQNLSLLSSTLEATDNAIVAIEFDGRIVAYNQKFLRVWGISAEELTAAGNLRELSQCSDLIKNQEEYFRKSNEFIRTRPELSNYLTVEFKDGRIYERFSHPQVLNGRIVGRVLSFRDITAQKQSERALRESERRNRELVDHSLGLICTHDLEGRWLMFNPAAAKALGYEPEELVGTSVKDILIQPSRSLFKFYLDVLKDKREHAGLMHFVTKAGEERIWAYHNVVVEDPDKFVYVLGHAQDITDLRRAEEEKRIAQHRLQFHLENSRLALVEWSKDWRITNWSPGAEKIFGWQASEVIGKDASKELKFVYDEDIAIVKEVLDSLSQGKKSEKPLINRNYKKDGSIITCEWFSTVQFDLNGEVSSFMTLAHDISERQQMQEKLREARDAALESARLKSEFLANMSHEIRTPMNGVIGMTDLMFNTALNAEQHEYAETIKSSANALLTVINDVLDFSKIEAGKLHFETIDFDLHNTIESTVEMFAEAAQSKHLELASLVESNVPIALRGDPGRLRQILTNLIGNGVKFTAEGEVVVRVSLERETTNSAWLCFAVKDTGIGIKKEAKNQLFQAFVQADGSTTRKYGGTGLGLAICRQLVGMMNGSFKVESEPGEGSTFSFTVQFEKQPVPQFNKISVSPSLKNPRVLIVDDNAASRQILEHHLRAWQIKVESASDAASALEKLRTAAQNGERFEAAILDLMMPATDGFELAQLIKSDAQINATKLILMSSFGARSNGEAARQAGIAGYLTKPVRQKDLFECIAAVIGEAAGEPVASQENAPQSITRHPLDENRFQTQNGKYILVAEDNLVNQKVIRGQLKRLGYSADVVGNGAEALSALQKRSYSLVLMDCQMPEMDGYAATTEFRRRENGSRRTPVIAVTANAMQGEREKCFAAGMDDYIAKPLKINVLQRTLERWLEGVAENGLEKDFYQVVAEKTIEIPVNMEALSDVTDNDPLMLREIVTLYLAQTDESLAALTEAVAANDAAEVYRLAHKTLGSSATCGMRAMVAPLKELEFLGRTGNLGTAQESVRTAQTNYRRLRLYLLDLLTQNN